MGPLHKKHNLLFLYLNRNWVNDLLQQCVVFHSNIHWSAPPEQLEFGALLKATLTVVEGEESYSFTFSTHILHETLGICTSQPPVITFSNLYGFMLLPAAYSRVSFNQAIFIRSGYMNIINRIFNTVRVYSKTGSQTMVFPCWVTLVQVRLQAVLENVLLFFYAEENFPHPPKKKRKKENPCIWATQTFHLFKQPPFPEVMV